MDVLVIGYGKIGRIKSHLWQSLGRQVYVYDTDVSKQAQAVNDGFLLDVDGWQYAEEVIVDISTPASYHLPSLRWALQRVPHTRSILMEKPLASSQAELEAIVQAAQGRQGDIAIDESYYLSTALRYVADDIKSNGFEITSIRAEMSKNRLADVGAGRFTDQNLGSLGLELPHMLAMIQVLGCSVDGLTVQDAVIFRDGIDSNNEGFSLQLASQGRPIVVESFLGDFRIVSNRRKPNEGIVRMLQVRTSAKDYTVTFDPVPGQERYTAQLHIRNHTTGKNHIMTTKDDHLRENLKRLHERQAGQAIDALLGLENAAQLTGFIFHLNDIARRITLQSPRSDAAHSGTVLQERERSL